MKTDANRVEELEARYRELELACRIWVAAGEAKDERILELEAECNALRQRVARLGRQVGRGRGMTAQRQIRFAR